MCDSDVPPCLMERQCFLEGIAAGAGHLVESHSTGPSRAAEDANKVFCIFAASGAWSSGEHTDLQGTNVVT